MMTYRHLFQTPHPISEETKNPQLNTSKNTANVLLVLTVVLLISFVPFHIWEMYFYFSVNPEDSVNKLKYLFDWDHKLNVITFIQQILLSFNSCLNLEAMFRTSRTFRSHFKRYLTYLFKTNSPPTDFKLLNRN
jgi:hypothetical protein